MARQQKKQQPKSVLQDWVESIVIALVLAVLIRSYIMQPFKIPSGSMRPTLLEDNTFDFLGHTYVIGDHIFVDKWTYGPQLLPPMFWDIGRPNEKPILSVRWPKFLLPLTKMRLPGFRKPQRGDIIVFVFPGDRTMDFIKRLIAVGGETVEIRNGSIYINGKEVTDPRIKKTYYYNYDGEGSFGAEGQVVHVPPGYDFVLGDNSGNSRDSRYWGFVPEANIIGKADVIFWPLPRVRILQ